MYNNYFDKFLLKEKKKEDSKNILIDEKDYKDMMIYFEVHFWSAFLWNCAFEMQETFNKWDF